jgi:hypothetical protein
VIPTEGEPRFKPVDPVWLTSPRDRELWLPLFSLAHALKLHKDEIGLLRRASVDLSWLKTQPAVRYHQIQEESVGSDTPAVEALVRDVWAVLGENEKHVATVDLLDRLYRLDTAPWRMFGVNGLTAEQLAAMFDRFGIGPVAIRLGKGNKGNANVAKGYKVAELRGIKLP